LKRWKRLYRRLSNCCFAAVLLSLLCICHAWGQLPRGWVYYFYSFSMPENSIIEAAKQIKEVGDKNPVLQAEMVLRGLKEDDWNQTLSAVLAFNQGIEVGAIIDPTLFDQYEITVVPTVVYVPAKVENGIPLYIKVSGDIPVPVALEKIEAEFERSQTK